MNKVRLTPEAVRDLTKIRRYISGELGSPSAARRIVGSITENLRLLERHIPAGPSVEALTGYPSDLRILVCGKYIAIYRVEGNTVSVARIFNARQDYIRILFGEVSLSKDQDTEDI